ncbi:MAG: hypothetical protein K0R33_1569 [Mycobacterium sp.]|nr:hypothetical protein [Mycobacterium sp.]
MTVQHGHHRRRPRCRKHVFEDPRRAVGQAASCLHRLEQQPGAGDAHDVGFDPLFSQPVGGGEGFGEHRTHSDQRHRGAAGVAQRVAAGDHLTPAAFSCRRIGRHRGEGLVDGAGRQAQIRRGAVRAAQSRDAVEQRPLKIDREGRFEADAAGLLEPDGRRLDRLMRTALRGKSDARRRADQDRLPAGVDAVGPRLQGALDERVIHHADREQRLSPPAPGGAEFTHQSHQIGLGDPEFHVLAGGLLPPVHDRFGVVVEPVAPLVR